MMRCETNHLQKCCSVRLYSIFCNIYYITPGCFFGILHIILIIIKFNGRKVSEFQRELNFAGEKVILCLYHDYWGCLSDQSISGTDHKLRHSQNTLLQKVRFIGMNVKENQQNYSLPLFPLFSCHLYQSILR